MAENLIVCDVDYDYYGAKIEKLWAEEDKILLRLLNTLKKAYTSGISKGEAHDALIVLYDDINYVYQRSIGKGKIVGNYENSFLKEIDDIDLNLYGE